jgi:hypothetical protein
VGRKELVPGPRRAGVKNDLVHRSGGVWSGVAVVQPCCAAASKGRQNKCFKMKELDFLLSTNFKLLSQMRGNSANNCDFIKKKLLNFRFFWQKHL